MDGLPQSRDGFGKAAELFQSIAFLMVGFDEGGIKLPGLPEIFQRFFKTAEKAEIESTIQSKRSGGWIGCNGAGE